MERNEDDEESSEEEEEGREFYSIVESLDSDQLMTLGMLLGLQQSGSFFQMTSNNNNNNNNNDDDDDDEDTEEDSRKDGDKKNLLLDENCSLLCTEISSCTGGAIQRKQWENVFFTISKRDHLHPFSFNQHKKAHILQRWVPSSADGQVNAGGAARLFCGGFSVDGDTYMSASQGHLINFYSLRHTVDVRSRKGDSFTEWKLSRQILASDVGWSILCTDYSPDSRWLVYSGWSDHIHLVNCIGEHEVHDQLLVNDRSSGHFCLFSVTFSPDSNEVLGGASDRHLYIYDLNRRELLHRNKAAFDDINACCYSSKDFRNDGDNLLFTAGDDCLIRIWDKRMLLRRGKTDSVGILVGHTQGITHLDSKGDGRYLISNGKDQCIKLWDLRKLDSSMKAEKYARSGTYDYRMGTSHQLLHQLPREVHPNDQSVSTYRGHAVSRTLIRSYFSPISSTGQRYIYSGSADSKIYVWDLVTGRIVTVLQGHQNLVRDCSWHHYEPMIISTSWDGTVRSWGMFGF